MYKDIDEKLHNKKFIITKRENEILYWAGMGKTYDEISIILDISCRTVKFHIHNIVKKLGVSNAKHAIKLATELQIVRPVVPLKK